MMIEKKKFQVQLQRFYETHKSKKYYSTKEVMKITGISLRTLRYRIRKLKNKYEEVPSLLFKKDNVWSIHRQILGEFCPKIRRVNTLYNMNWKSFVTWTTLDRFDSAYHHQLASEIKDAFPMGHFDYTIEKTKQQVNHVHLVSSLEPVEIEVEVDQIINNYLPKTDYRLEVSKVQSKPLSRNYFNK